MTGGKGTARCAAVLCGISLNRILSWLSVLIEAALGVNFFVPLTCVNAGHEYPLVKRAGGAPQMYGSYQWSMEDYREQLRQYREQNAEGSQEAWDELEKSVVSRVADDVKVSILGRTVEMTIVKRMA